MRRSDNDRSEASAVARTTARVLVIPGLHGSGPGHWQHWLQDQYAGARRVEQDDWHVADLDRWSANIERTVRSADEVGWIAVAHSFGCLALAHYLQGSGRGIAGLLMVAPADPRKFGVAHRLPLHPLGVHGYLVASESDPWMRIESASAWALLWAVRFMNIGRAGHVNAEAGFGPFPVARQLVDELLAAAPAASKTRLQEQDPAWIARTSLLRFAI